MIKILRSNRILFCSALTSLTVDEENIQRYKAARGLYIKDPWERVKTIFCKDDHGNIHPELNEAYLMFRVGIAVGGCYGGLKVVSRKREAYLHSNDMNVYANAREAFKAYANHNVMSFVEGAIKSAIPFGCFLFSFSLITSCCELYRNKPSIIDSTVAGTVVGSLSRSFFGIKGMISGGVVGGVLGTIYGVLVWGLTKISNTDQVEIKYASFALMNYRKELYYKESLKVSNEEKVIKDKPLDELDELNELKQNKVGSSEQINTNI